ncbi:uncharacterized protein LOC133200775 [Saccostrea echinata]|uniref:uncharacterized protein LOC133200775 n=1 Tax=Saccostrea echinata TaxID=191078 RepID=UPI002A804631|nr:uncharacterized protein LOC133200775 [Saccostrea echinata]
MKQKEIRPLLEGNEMYPKGMAVVQGRVKMYVPEDKVEIDDDFEDEILMTERRRKRRVSLLWQDCFLLILDFLQFFAIYQSMALRWTWPHAWLSNTYFVFIFNLDFFEFMKIHTAGVYASVQNYNTPSSSVPVQFSTISIGWLVVTLILAAVYPIIYAVLWYRKSPAMLTKMAYVRRVYYVVIQALTLPLATYVGHIFQCTNTDTVDVMNDLTCFSGLHWLYVTFGLVIMLFLFVVFPLYLVYITRTESVGSCSKHHESFLLLKETEYKVGLNKSWLHADMFVFSSFRFWGLYHRAVMQWLKLPIIIALCAGFNNISGQALSVTLLFWGYFVLFIFVRPYRIFIYNLMMLLSFLSLGCLGIIGSMVTRYNVYTLSSPWLLPQYSKWVLTTIVVSWAVFWFLFMVYLVIRSILYQKKIINTPLWPTFSTSDNDHLSLQTKKFLKTFLHARFVLERTQRSPALFAPVHDLSRQIQILNAYCREAEFLGDALHGTMWDLLDEMIEIHAKLAQKSLFAETVKESIRKTAKEFLSVMPLFSQRLAQRDYDLILVSPMKRRMLLKMYCMGVFLNGRAEKVRKKAMFTQPALEKIWHEEPYSLNLEEEDGYYEDLYPDPIELKSDDSSVDLSMASSESEEEEENLAGILSQLQEEEEMEFDLLRSQSLAEDPVSAENSSTTSGSRPGTALQSNTNRPQSGATRHEGGFDNHSPRPSSGSSHPESRPSSGSRPHSAILGPGLRQTSGSSPRGSRPSSGVSTHSKHSVHSKKSVHSKQSTSDPNKEGGYINSGFVEEKPSSKEKPRKDDISSIKKFADAKVVAGRLKKKRSRKRDSEA